MFAAVGMRLGSTWIRTIVVITVRRDRSLPSGPTDPDSPELSAPGCRWAGRISVSGSQVYSTDGGRSDRGSSWTAMFTADSFLGAKATTCGRPAAGPWSEVRGTYQ